MSNELNELALDEVNFIKTQNEPGKGKRKSFSAVSPRINVRDIEYALEELKKNK